MRKEDHPAFMQLLAKMMARYGKPLPEADINRVWLEALAPFPPAVIAQAFTDYAMERPDFPPAPNSIAGRCLLLDGRPGENEAWAAALQSRDPHATVVWTHEMAEAFGHAQLLLEQGDTIGGRMAFKEAYSRMVAAARARGEPVQWKVSEGWGDRTGGKSRKLAIEKAQRDGLLPAPAAQLLLENSSGSRPEQNSMGERPEALKRVLELVATLEDPWEKAERKRLERLAAEEEADKARKAEIAAQVASYQKDKP